MDTCEDPYALVAELIEPYAMVEEMVEAGASLDRVREAIDMLGLPAHEAGELKLHGWAWQQTKPR